MQSYAIRFVWVGIQRGAIVLVRLCQDFFRFIRFLRGISIVCVCFANRKEFHSTQEWVSRSSIDWFVWSVTWNVVCHKINRSVNRYSKNVCEFIRTHSCVSYEWLWWNSTFIHVHNLLFRISWLLPLTIWIRVPRNGRAFSQTRKKKKQRKGILSTISSGMDICITAHFRCRMIQFYSKS